MFLLRTRFTPPSPYTALTLGPFLLIRRGAKLTPTLLCHETIHWHQCRELLVVFFYLFYVLEWLFRILQEAFRHRKRPVQASPLHPRASLLTRAYLRISFEREAYAHQSNPQYLRKRKPWAFLNFLTEHH